MHKACKDLTQSAAKVESTTLNQCVPLHWFNDVCKITLVVIERLSLVSAQKSRKAQEELATWPGNS